MSVRYAIYLAPGIGGDTTGVILRDAAEAWLGRSVDPATTPPSLAVPEGWSRADVDAITGNARRYGFHATVKAPFALAPGHAVAELTDRLPAFAARYRPVVIPSLTLTCLGGFFALIAGAGSPALQSLADDVVREFDDLRAPATEAEIARRRPERLDERERELLAAYGYPYVLDRFLFHLTLTDPVPAPRQRAVESVLRQQFHPVLGADLVIGSLALFVEPGPRQPFVLAASYPFRKEAP